MLELVFCSIETRNVYSVRETVDALGVPWDVVVSYWNGEKWIVIDVYDADNGTVEDIAARELSEGL